MGYEMQMFYPMGETSYETGNLAILCELCGQSARIHD